VFLETQLAQREDPPASRLIEGMSLSTARSKAAIERMVEGRSEP